MDVEFLDGQTAQLKKKHIVVEEGTEKFMFQANWENKGNYYACNILENITNDFSESTQYTVQYVDDGIVKQVNIRRIRAYQ